MAGFINQLLKANNRLLLKPGASPTGDGSTSSPRARLPDALILPCPPKLSQAEAGSLSKDMSYPQATQPSPRPAVPQRQKPQLGSRKYQF